MVMSGEEETISQRRGGAGGSQTDLKKESTVERDTGNEARLPPSKLRDGSTMSGAGKTIRGAEKTKSMILESLKEGVRTQTILLPIKRSPTSNCQAHSQKIQTHSAEW